MLSAAESMFFLFFIDNLCIIRAFELKFPVDIGGCICFSVIQSAVHALQ